jgi:hypothetical protein
MTKAKAKADPSADGCHNCRFWLEDFEAGIEGRNGLCRPGPATVLWDGEVVFSTWPTTDYTDWCGAHQKVMQ